MNKFQVIAAAFVSFIMLCVISTSGYAQQFDSDSVVITNRDSLGRELNGYDSTVQAMKEMPVSADTIIRPVITKDSLLADSSQMKRKPWSRPKKAMVWAMVLPGAGQAYNRTYWKMPILYAGLGVLTYMVVINQGGYSEFSTQYEHHYKMGAEDPTYTFIWHSSRTDFNYSTLNQLRTERDAFRRQRDLAAAGILLCYTISILDAYVTAHLKDFDLSPDLSMSVKPMFYTYNNATFIPTPGVSLSLKFKNRYAGSGYGRPEYF
jgi:hypothetical protein